MREFVLVLILLAAGMPEGLHAQRAFTGTITYVATDDDRPETDVPAVPDTIRAVFSGERFRYDEITLKGMRTVLTNTQKIEQYILFNLLGQNIALISPPDALEEALLHRNRPYGEEPQTAMPIAGMSAATFVHQGQSVVFASGFGGAHPNLPVAPGPVLEFTYPNSNVRFRAVHIDQATLPEATFEVPQNYKKLTTEELQMMFGLPAGE